MSQYDYIREAYQMPWLKQGAIVRVMTGDLGTVTKADTYVHVRLDGEKRAVPYHPNDVKKAR